MLPIFHISSSVGSDLGANQLLDDIEGHINSGRYSWFRSPAFANNNEPVQTDVTFAPVAKTFLIHESVSGASNSLRVPHPPELPANRAQGS